MHQGINEKSKEYKGDGRPFDHENHRVPKAERKALKSPVEPGKKPVDPAHNAVLGGRGVLQQDSAHCRAQGEGHEPGDGHGNNDGDGELLVELSRGAGKECRRDKD